MGVDADEGIKELTEEWLEDSLESFYGFATSNVGGIKTTDNTKEGSKGTTKGVSRFTKGYKLWGGYS